MNKKQYFILDFKTNEFKLLNNNGSMNVMQIGEKRTNIDTFNRLNDYLKTIDPKLKLYKNEDVDYKNPEVTITMGYIKTEIPNDILRFSTSKLFNRWEDGKFDSLGYYSSKMAIYLDEKQNKIIIPISDHVVHSSSSNLKFNLSELSDYNSYEISLDFSELNNKSIENVKFVCDNLLDKINEDLKNINDPKLTYLKNINDFQITSGNLSMNKTPIIVCDIKEYSTFVKSINQEELNSVINCFNEKEIKQQQLDKKSFGLEI